MPHLPLTRPVSAAHPYVPWSNSKEADWGCSWSQGPQQCPRLCWHCHHHPLPVPAQYSTIINSIRIFPIVEATAILSTSYATITFQLWHNSCPCLQESLVSFILISYSQFTVLCLPQLRYTQLSWKLKSCTTVNSKSILCRMRNIYRTVILPLCKLQTDFRVVFCHINAAVCFICTKAMPQEIFQISFHIRTSERKRERERERERESDRESWSCQWLSENATYLLAHFACYLIQLFSTQDISSLFQTHN